MRTIQRLVSLGVVLLFGCSPPPPPPAAPAAAPLNSVLNLKQVMEWVLDPAADVIWDSVKSVSTEAGTREIQPENDEQWAAVRNAAATLSEAGNLLMVSGRARDQKEWPVLVGNLMKASEAVMKAAEAKNKEAIFAAGGDVYVVCKGCHVRYAPHLSSSLAAQQLAFAPASIETPRTAR